ncbi:glycerophosphodiester phosphodiesterase [Sporosarcina sp. FSL K6-1522]|uniref:glycerophosphodiester phosphodiesterase n=1 Tax=Sporosarcina sp. FSL K6-1522 TaxID=2921554 RepID=UPI00315A5C28
MDIYAHRGSSGTHPENTLAAFREAAHLPIAGVEFDIHLTKDGELVVIHDESIHRTSNGSGFVKDLTLAELKTYDFGSWFAPNFQDERIPTLQEVLECFSNTHHRLNIELKSDIFPYDGMIEKVVDIIEAMQLHRRVILSSFDHSAIQKVKQLAPHLETAALVMEVLVKPLDYMRTIPTDALHLFFPTALRPAIQEVLAENIAVRTFTVNEELYALALKNIGVQAIFTDYPEKMLTFLHAKS